MKQQEHIGDLMQKGYKLRLHLISCITLLMWFNKHSERVGTTSVEYGSTMYSINSKFETCKVF